GRAGDRGADPRRDRAAAAAARRGRYRGDAARHRPPARGARGGRDAFLKALICSARATRIAGFIPHHLTGTRHGSRKEESESQSEEIPGEETADPKKEGAEESRREEACGQARGTQEEAGGASLAE